MLPDATLTARKSETDSSVNSIKQFIQSDLFWYQVILSSRTRKGAFKMEIKNTTDILYVDRSVLSGSTFRDCDLNTASFEDINLSGSTFANINMLNTTFTDINMSGVIITDCRLSGMSISDCDLDGMKINGIEVTELIKAYTSK